MDGANCNTYQNQITNATTKINKHCRYYYNLENIRGNKDTQGKKLLIWSVNRYAHSSVSGMFTGGEINGDCNMIGLSYYPVDLTSGETIIPSGTTVKFYNDKIEQSEAGSGNSDSSVRSTRSSVNESQHRLMH